MKTITLTQGKVALVDDEDFEFLSQWKWSIQKKPHDKYYARTSIKINGKWRRVTMHRMILRPQNGRITDHINNNGLDNRRCNLRCCNQSQNLQNRTNQPHSSRFKGVSWVANRKRWLAAICVEGKRINLGRFIGEDEAAKAYDRAAKCHFGSFANTNFSEAI